MNGYLINLCQGIEVINVAVIYFLMPFVASVLFEGIPTKGHILLFLVKFVFRRIDILLIFTYRLVLTQRMLFCHCFRCFSFLLT